MCLTNIIKSSQHEYVAPRPRHRLDAACLRGPFKVRISTRDKKTMSYQHTKREVLLRSGHEGPEGEKMYSCTLSATSVLDGVGGQRHAPAALPPGKTR